MTCQPDKSRDLRGRVAARERDESDCLQELRGKNCSTQQARFLSIGYGSRFAPFGADDAKPRRTGSAFAARQSFPVLGMKRESANADAFMSLSSACRLAPGPQVIGRIFRNQPGT